MKRELVEMKAKVARAEKYFYSFIPSRFYLIYAQRMSVFGRFCAPCRIIFQKLSTQHVFVNCSKTSSRRNKPLRRTRKFTLLNKVPKFSEIETPKITKLFKIQIKLNFDRIFGSSSKIRSK